LLSNVVVCGVLIC